MLYNMYVCYFSSISLRASTWLGWPKILSEQNEIRPNKQSLDQNHIIKYEHYYPAQCLCFCFWKEFCVRQFYKLIVIPNVCYIFFFSEYNCNCIIFHWYKWMRRVQLMKHLLFFHFPFAERAFTVRLSWIFRSQFCSPRT